MTDRLSLYNDALLLCGERALTSLSEDREPRRLLDQIWNSGGVNVCLAEGQWFFAMRALPGRVAYAAAKHGVVGITRVLAVEWADRPIRVNAVAPGWRTAPVLAPLFSRRSAETLADLLSKALPTGTGPANITAVAISAEALTPGPWTRTVIAGEPTLAGVAAACAAAANGAALSTDKTP